MENPYFSRVMDAVDMMVQDQRQKQAENRAQQRNLQMLDVQEERERKTKAAERKFSVLSGAYNDKTAEPDFRKQAYAGLIGMVNNPDMEMPELTPQFETPYVTLPDEIRNAYPMLADPNVKWKKEDVLQIQKLIQAKEAAESKQTEATRHNTAMEKARLREVSIQDKKISTPKPEKDASLARVKKLRDEAYAAYRDLSIKKGGESAYTGMVEEDDVYQYIARVDELISKAESKMITPAERKELEGLESVLTKGYKGTQRKAAAGELTSKLQTILEKIEKEL